MVVLWEAELSGNGIVQVILTDRLAGLGVSCGGVAGLNHEIGNDAMPQDAVVIAFSYELEEVVAMKGCLVVQLDDDVALRRAEQDLVTRRVNLRGVS